MKRCSTGNHWAFERKGWFRQRVIIRSVGTGEEPAQHIYRSSQQANRADEVQQRTVFGCRKRCVNARGA